MRKRAQRNFTRMSLSVLAAVMAVAAFSGCGGGGGGGGGNNGNNGGINGNQGGGAPAQPLGPLNSTVADVTGKVVDSSNGQGVAGVTISIPGSTPVTTRSD